jgi:subtilase family serine protease
MYRRLLFGRLWRPVARTASFGVLIALFLVCGALYAETTTVKLSPLVARSTLLGPVDGSREIGVTLALPLSDPEGVAEFVRQVSTAGDPLFRHYLTPQQFAQRFGGNAADYAYLKSWAAANGLRVTHESLGRINLTVRGSVTQFQRLFNTQLSTYRAPDGQEFYSANVEPVVPSEIASRISGVIGLTESKMVTPMVKVAKCLGEDPAPASNLLSPDTAGGTGPGGSYSAANLRSVYNIPTFGHLNPNAVAAVFEQGGYDSSDVTKYLTYNRLPKVTVTPVSVDSSPTSVQDDASVELEAVLDIDMIAGINPAISAIRVYIDSYNWDPFQTALLDAITQVADDDVAQVFSISYGQDEGYQGTTAIAAENTALAQLASEGITVTASSGDSGAYGDGYNYPYNVSDPASQPYITGVGGTTLRTGPHEIYEVEEAWNDLALGYGATGGGVSSYWPVPDFQNSTLDGPGYLTFNGGSATYRNVPDVAAVGDPITGVGIYSAMNGGWNQVGGTSLSSPIWASYLTIVDAGLQYAGIGNLGWFNPVLYQVGYSLEDLPSKFLYGVTQGSNGDTIQYPGYPGYFNGVGYSNTTGNGSLQGSLLGTQLLISGSQPGNKPGQITSFANSNLTYDSATFQWRPVANASAYELAVFRQTTPNNFLDAVVIIDLTKDTTATATQLVPNFNYWAYLWAFNSSGGSMSNEVIFKTPKKP